MTYNVFGGTLNPAQSNPIGISWHINLIIWGEDSKSIDFKMCKFLPVQDLWSVVVGSSQPEAVGAQQAAMEASLSVEVSMIVLDTVTLYVNSFKVISLCTV